MKYNSKRKEKGGFISFNCKTKRYFFEGLSSKEIKTIYENGFDIPLRIQWRITKLCNLNCKHCYLNKRNIYQEELSKRELIKIAKLIVKHDIFEVLVTGGEPTIKEGLKEVLSILCKKCNVTLFTNVYDSEKIRELLPLFKKYKKSLKLNVSLYGTKEIHDFVRQEGSFERALHNIKELTKNGIDVTINTVLTKQFIPKLEEYIKNLEDSGVKALQFSKFYPLGEGKHFIQSMPSLLEFKNVTKRLIFLSKQVRRFEIVFDHTFCFLLGENKQKVINRKCSGGFSKMVIESNGDVYPCQLLPLKKFNMGNILKDDFLEVWNSKNKKRFIKDFFPEECKMCNQKENCLGGCKAASYSIHKTFKHKDPYCFYEK
jgi:radical SAM protein with 4Fe4S-binding SPASM domain